MKQKAEIDDFLRTFDTGATRSPLGSKLSYAGFLSSIVLKRFAEYMHDHRVQSNGEVRDAGNWKRGIPQDSYMDSMFRHFMDVYLHQEGFSELATEDIETALCGLLFNVQGMLHEVLSEARKV